VVGVLSTIAPIAIGQPLNTAQIARRVAPTVVVIEGKTASGGTLVGSGFIATKDGKIVTSLHVIKDLQTATVQLANGRTVDSLLVLAADEKTDLAIIQISGFTSPKPNGDALDSLLADLPRLSQVLDLGNSDNVAVGEPVVVVGSPSGLGGTVTAGILSSVRDSNEGFKLLQTDAAVNPGNSGGPLVNGRAQAIGVIWAKLPSAEGLNFAVPINCVRSLLGNLHEPMTLDQMRASLSTVSTAEQPTKEPSLRETLDWLKEKIPLGAVHYTMRSNDGFAGQMSEQSVALSLDSCTAIAGRENAVTLAGNRGGFRLSYTVPLGALMAGEVARLENVWTGAASDAPYVGPGNSGVFVNGDKWGYRVILKSTSTDIFFKSVGFGSPPPPNPDTTKNTNTLYLIFNDESLARRVLTAFLHAADPCRKKELFWNGKVGNDDGGGSGSGSSGGADGKVSRVGGGVSAPVLLSKTEPMYSEEALKAKLEGTVTLYVQIDPSGHPTNIKVVKSLGLGLDENALDAVQKWTFRPGMLKGEPVTVEATIDVSFRLNVAPPKR
jgi:TonB family protein